ncbi:MAG: type II toxin-antitoxin system HicB family antitoxin [Candidatus Methylumidiphilus alinenensis]|uniref:Type II toxin-antitoxin system HicB family antitoxin n=1 Tax=Candidatus Methylumidiphilus alinenensis TaxID=2202197 RepID=A0A2W4RPR1_9GAMM|nr:MAG: type II toxin-antitoxin system HicB family antitoxin [Candidatus Methylumidiphilus alinenensis]
MNEYKYPLEVFWDEGSEAFVCIAPDLPGCSAIGDTPQEAVHEIETAMRLWIQAAASLGRELPTPSRKAA